MTPRQRANRQKRRIAERNAMLKGNANRRAVEKIYARMTEMRANGHDVHCDHIIPLRAKLACGLTTPANLQIITADEDRCKGNSFTPFSVTNGRREFIR